MNKSANYKLAKIYANNNNIDPDTFEYMEDIDPTPNKKYLFQMLKWYVNPSTRVEPHSRPYVIDNILHYIDRFAKIAPIKKVQIENFKTIDDFVDFMVENERYTTKSENRVKLSKDVEKIFENKNVIVVHMKSFEAICLYGAGTRWCITGKDGHFYDRYKKDNTTFYFIFNKKEKPGSELFKIAVAVNDITKVTGYTPIDKFMDYDVFDKFLKDNNIDKSIFINRE